MAIAVHRSEGQRVRPGAPQQTNGREVVHGDRPAVLPRGGPTPHQSPRASRPQLLDGVEAEALERGLVCVDPGPAQVFPRVVWRRPKPLQLTAAAVRSVHTHPQLSQGVDDEVFYPRGPPSEPPTARVTTVSRRKVAPQWRVDPDARRARKRHARGLCGARKGRIRFCFILRFPGENATLA